jgi:hypothetical protein
MKVRRLLTSILALILLAPGAAEAQGPLAGATNRICLPFAARGGAGSPLEIVFEFGQTVRPGADARDLAVAFHTVHFVDANAYSLGVLTLGTAEANVLQGEGWWNNETCPGVGPIQWAGGANKRATIRLSPPTWTVGLLLHLRSIQDDLPMQVRVNGALVAAVCVDTRWHQAYVPLTGPLSAPTPGAEPQWTAGRYFPSFPAASLLYSIRVDTELKDWWNQASSPQWRISAAPDTMMGLTLVGMQGVINRHGAAVFLDWDDNGASRSPSHYWLGLLRQRVPVVELDLDDTSAFYFLYQRFGGRFGGAVVYDPQVPDTINLATMYAGLEDRVILAPEQLAQPGLPTFASLTDLRPLAQAQGWDTSEDGKYRLYDWVYHNLWPRLEHRVIGVSSPGPPTSRPISGDPGPYFPLGLASRDHLVALRAPVLWLSPVEEPQATLFSHFVQEAPAPAPVYGFFAYNEEGTVALASRNGGWCPALTNGNAPLSSGNLTVLGAVRPELQRYPAEISAERVLATLSGKPVLTVWSSDGDSLQFQLDRGFHGFNYLFWDGVQGRRFGWTINPVLADVAPIVWNDYVSTRDQVSLVCGLSGAGYMYPALMSDAQLHTYVQRTATYMAQTGLRVVHLDARFSPLLNALSSAVMGRYYQDLHSSGYLGAFVDMSGLPWGLGFHYAGTPAPSVPPSYVLDQHNAAAVVADILTRQPGQYRVELTAPLNWYWGQEGATYGWQNGTVVLDAGGHLGTSLRFASDDAYSPGLVVWGPFSALGPGTYDVTYRLKVASKSETGIVAQAYVGTADAGWRTLGQRFVRPSDFAQAGQYQDVTVTLTLASVITNVEFRLDYYGGQAGYATTALYADQIIATRREPLDLPVMSAAFAVPDMQSDTPPLDIVQQFEAAGGLVLTPDEFIAMLNPEFMIEWATPRLGASHPSLVEARAHLAAGRYMESLLAVRGGLRTALPSSAAAGLTASRNSE